MFVATEMILVAAPTNDIVELPAAWLGSVTSVVFAGVQRDGTPPHSTK